MTCQKMHNIQMPYSMGIGVRSSRQFHNMSSVQRGRYRWLPLAGRKISFLDNLKHRLLLKPSIKYRESLIDRGVTRLDVARGKKQLLRPHVRTRGLSEAMYCIEESTCDTVGTFRRPIYWFGAQEIVPPLLRLCLWMQHFLQSILPEVANTFKKHVRAIPFVFVLFFFILLDLRLYHVIFDFLFLDSWQQCACQHP